MQRTPHSTPARPKQKKMPRSKKAANGVIGGTAVALALGGAVAVVQSQQAQAQNAQASSTYAPAVTYTPGPVADRVVIIGDSFTAGSAEGGNRDASWTQLIRPMVRDEEHPTEFSVLGLGGSGYVANGSSGKNFLDAVMQRVTPTTDVVVVFGSMNDGGHAGKVGAAATEVYDYIEKTAPDAQLVVIGPQIPYDEPTDRDTAIAGEVRQAAEGKADVYVDPIAGDWFDNGAIIGEDGVHPTDEGHQHMAELIALTLREALEPVRSVGADQG